MITHALTVGPVQTNCYVVGRETPRQAGAVAPGWNAPSILAAVDSFQATVKLILLTHAHFDHIGALADVVDATKAPVAMHPLDLPLLREGGGARGGVAPIRPSPG